MGHGTSGERLAWTWLGYQCCGMDGTGDHCFGMAVSGPMRLNAAHVDCDPRLGVRENGQKRTASRTFRVEGLGLNIARY